MKRPPITERIKIDSLLFRALCNGGAIRCHVCGHPIIPGMRIIWDHVGVYAIDGKHDHESIGPIHDGPDAELQCNKRKTFGTKATTAGSDIHKVSKIKRIQRTQKMLVKHKWDTSTYIQMPAEKPKRKWAKRKMKSGNKFSKPVKSSFSARRRRSLTSG